MKILADKHIPYLQGVAEQFGEVTYLPGDQFTKETVKENEVLIVRTVTRFDESILKDSNVKLICSATIGYDHIDTAYCRANNISWRTAPGCNAGSVEQYVTASLILMADKRNFELKDKTIGIVGVGNVGKKVARACELLGMKVLLNDPPREEAEQSNAFVDIATIQREADFITFHTPLIKEGKHATYHLVDGNFLQGLVKKPIIINSSRGSVVDNSALKRALRNDNISGAIIDTWEKEPHIDRKLLELVDIGTPHIAGYSADGKWNATKMTLYTINDLSGLQKYPVQLIPIHEPKNNVIDVSLYSVKDQLGQAILKTYNPLNDSLLLKEDPSKFYHFRSHYPLRREYRAYIIENLNTLNRSIAKELGFNVEQ